MPEPAMKAGAPPRLVLLDGLRGLAALLVVLMHAADTTVATTVFDRGYLAVDLFFLLSGFVLTLAFDPRFAAGMTPWAFMRLRIARLWPTIAIGMGIGAVLVFSLSPPEVALRATALNLMLVPAQCGGKGLYCLNGPAWSLACEFAANLLHVLVLWRLSSRWLGAITVLAGAGLAYAIFLHGHADIGVNIDSALGGYLRCAFAYPLGMLIARQWRARPRQDFPWWAGLVPPVLVPFALQQIEAPGALLDALSCLVVLPLCFWIATRTRPAARIEPVLAWLGKRSYPLYAVNFPVKHLTICAAVALGQPDGPAVMVAIIVMSLLVTELVLLSSRPRAASAPPAKAAAATA